MGGAKRFEDLIAWQKARELTSAIYRTTREKHFLEDTGLIRQMQRAAVSIMSNIAEGFECGSSADFHHFLVIAKASCAELRLQLYVALDNNHLNQQQFDKLMLQATKVARVIGGLRASVAKMR